MSRPLEPKPAVVPPIRGADIVELAARLLVGGVFVYLGLSKALAPVEFLKLVRQYGILDHPIALNLVAATMPWFEIVCGILLLLGVAVRGTTVLVAGLLVAFTAAIALRAMDLHAAGGGPFCAIKFDCGCGAGEVFACRKLLENALLVGVAARLVVSSSRRWCLRPAIVTARDKATHW